MDEAGAAVESAFPDAGHAARDRDTIQTEAADKSPVSDAGHSIRDYQFPYFFSI